MVQRGSRHFPSVCNHSLSLHNIIWQGKHIAHMHSWWITCNVNTIFFNCLPSKLSAKNKLIAAKLTFQSGKTIVL